MQAPVTVCSIGRDTKMQTETTTRPVGRPTYPDEVYVGILERHAEGEHLITILEEPGMPSWATFFRQCAGREAPQHFQDAYASAHESWAHKYIAQGSVIADTQEMGETTTTKEWGTERKTDDMLGHRTLKVKTRQWFAERLLAKIYAAKQQTTLQNPDGSAIDIQPVINLTVLPPTKE